MSTRRQFLGAGLSAVTLGGNIPGLFARAADDAARAEHGDRVLVVVELAGGNDGLNTVIPFEDDLYHKARPALHAAKEQVHKLSDQVGLHPSMEAVARLFKDGHLAVVQGVGYPEPDRSHFRSMEIWHTASTARRPPQLRAEVAGGNRPGPGIFPPPRGAGLPCGTPSPPGAAGTGSARP